SAAASAAFGANARHFRTHQEAADAVGTDLGRDVTVLVKGSRSSAMERVVQALLAQFGAPSKGGGTHAA
ncbi:MAG TPA: UDP-N-acetylmuramoyl-tripeptide--D-alanyl-D-alanine ligase, partial [Xanthomonadales bacterium]|nr:UDP-N-acetylmuramoyl-tripeptide--D-alanyl-D-alanine ligase [Xanthomonadales bacterium]